MVSGINSRLPPLHIDSPRYQEDMREGRDRNKDLSFSSDDSLITDTSFQEALIREKAHVKGRDDRIKLTTLTRGDSRYLTPHKKVVQEDSG